MVTLALTLGSIAIASAILRPRLRSAGGPLPILAGPILTGNAVTLGPVAPRLRRILAATAVGIRGAGFALCRAMAVSIGTLAVSIACARTIAPPRLAVATLLSAAAALIAATLLGTAAALLALTAALWAIATPLRAVTIMLGAITAARTSLAGAALRPAIARRKACAIVSSAACRRWSRMARRGLAPF